MEIHLIRHTPVNFNKNKCYGQLDVPLNDTFNTDVEKIKSVLKHQFSTIYSSPKTRCTALAEALGYNNFNTDNRILELNFGDWEGQFWNDINKNDLNKWMADFVNVAPINGESLKEMYLRVTEFIDELRLKKEDNILIIAHAGVIRCFIAYFLEIPLKNIFRIPVGFFETFIFNLGENKALDSILKLNNS